MNKLWSAGLLILALGLSRPVLADDAGLIPLPDIRQKTLLNDFRAILLPGAGESFVLDLAIANGAVFDPPGKEGCALLTGRYVSQSLRQSLREAAEIPPDGPDPVQASLAVEADFIRFTLSGPAKELLPAGLAMEAVLNRIEFDEARFQAIKDQVFLETAKVEDAPETLARREWRRMQYEPFPYGNNPHGTTATLTAIELKDVIRFYRRCFMPNRSLLVMQSALAEPEFKRFVIRHFGSWTKREAPEYAFTQPKKRAPTEPRTRCIPVASAPESCLWFGWDCVREKDDDFEAAQLLAELLQSRLDKLLSSRPGYRARVHCVGLMLGGSFTISVCGPPQFDLALSRQIQELLEEIARGRFSLAEFQDIQARRLALCRQHLAGDQLAAQILRAEIYRLGARYLKLSARRIENIIKEDLSYVVSQYLPWEKTRIVAVSPGTLGADAMPEQLRPAVDMTP